MHDAQLFVAALGASSYTWAEATWSRGCADWIGAHAGVEFFGGVPKAAVPDNLKSGITKAVLLRARRQPDATQEMADHYGSAYRSGAPIQATRQGNGFILHLVLMMAR